MSRRRGLFVGTTVFSILAVGTFVFLNKLIGLIVFSIIDLEQGSDSNISAVLIASFVVLVLATITLPTLGTHILLRKFP
ncbi:MAG: hypothetical protein OXG15_08010 [Gammaproteobacteria bacterium]|nr:hypothetical protein [Gammaproteobacteria bacterium]